MDKYEARSPCQWAQRGQSFTSAVLYKILQIEDSRIMHYSMSWMETYYAGCYYPIMPNVALINSQKFGATKPACRTLGKVWQGLQHHVKTASEVSNKHYPIEVSGNIHSGSGQGSVYATLCWEGITQQIISILEREKSASVTNCFTLRITSRTCNFYVDDKSLMCTHDHNESTTQNVKKSSTQSPLASKHSHKDQNVVCHRMGLERTRRSLYAARPPNTSKNVAHSGHDAHTPTHPTQRNKRSKQNTRMSHSPRCQHQMRTRTPHE
jgi:hypothetical protein